jgi:hypothetical protein
MENSYNMQKQIANLIKSDDDECLNFSKDGYQTTTSPFLLNMNCNFTPFFSKSPIYCLPFKDILLFSRMKNEYVK